MACGEIGLTLSYFYSLTPRQFNNIITGYRQREERADRNLYETTRMIMYAALSPYAKENFKPTDILKFPWEEDKQTPELKERKPKTKKELKKLFK